VNSAVNSHAACTARIPAKMIAQSLSKRGDGEVIVRPPRMLEERQS
jgi:hypothetical protein